jgi:hypothetical protein
MIKSFPIIEQKMSRQPPRRRRRRRRRRGQLMLHHRYQDLHSLLLLLVASVVGIIKFLVSKVYLAYPLARDQLYGTFDAMVPPIRRDWSIYHGAF